ncbi:LuxR family transcriptional regulator [Pectobacterium versatile]|nr:LuxR family transcriptional regulator [Pectobacterium versatile]
MYYMDVQCSYLNEKSIISRSDYNIVKLIEREMRLNHLEFYSYMRLNKKNQNVKLISTFPKQWQDIYLENRYYNFDPVIEKAKCKISPFLWGSECGRIFEEAREFAILSGVCFIAHRNDGFFSVLSICNRHDDKNFINQLREKEAKIQMLLLKCFEEDITSETEVCCNVNLTPRECEVLKLLGLGKTYCEISIICSISERTVRFHVMNILKRFQVANIKQALAQAACQGFFDA